MLSGTYDFSSLSAQNHTPATLSCKVHQIAIPALGLHRGSLASFADLWRVFLVANLPGRWHLSFAFGSATVCHCFGKLHLAPFPPSRPRRGASRRKIKGGCRDGEGLNAPVTSESCQLLCAMNLKPTFRLDTQHAQLSARAPVVATAANSCGAGGPCGVGRQTGKTNRPEPAVLAGACSRDKFRCVDGRRSVRCARVRGPSRKSRLENLAGHCSYRCSAVC